MQDSTEESPVRTLCKTEVFSAAMDVEYGGSAAEPHVEETFNNLPNPRITPIVMMKHFKVHSDYTSWTDAPIGNVVKGIKGR